MNLISIETQRKLMYIPFLNLLNYFIWFINIVRAKVPTSCWAKGFWSIVVHAIPVWFVCTALGRIIPGIVAIAWICTIYFTPLAMSYGSIKFQEKYLF